MVHEAEQLKGISPSLPISFRAGLRFIPVALTCLMLIACGGGGSVSGSTNSNITMSVSPQSVSVSAMTTQPAPTASFQVNVTGLSPGQRVYLAAKTSTQGISTVVNPGGMLPATITIEFKSPATLGAGTFDDTVQVEGCLDQACSQQIGNSPQRVQVQYIVTKSTLTLTALNPSSAYAGAQGFLLNVMGSTFTQQSTVLWNGNSLPTTFVSSSQLTAQVPSADIATAGSASISVSDLTYGITNLETFTVNPSPLMITSLSPASGLVGGPTFTLTVTGMNFTSQSTVLWNDNSQATTFVSTTQLTTQIPTIDIATLDTAAVSVSDPTFGISNTEIFTVTPAPLAITSLSPTSVTVGGPFFMVTVLGISFTGTSTVQWNGTALATTLVSSTELIAKVPASNISATGTASVTVVDPNSPSGTTSAQTVTIAPASKDAVAFQINPAHTGAVNFNSVTFPTSAKWSVDVGGTPSYALIVDGKVIVTVELSGGTSEILALDQATGNTVWGPITLGAVANASYDNGRVFVLSGTSTATATLEALDVNTGALDWSTGVTVAIAITGLPMAAGGTVYEISNGVVFARDESTGALLWTQAMEVWGDTSLSPAVTVDGVYASSSCQVSDLRPATGESIWSNAFACSDGGSGLPTVANQLDYSDNAGSGYSGNIFNAETGANEGSYSVDTPPTFTTTMGYFLQGGTLRGITLSNNTVQWSFSGDGFLTGSPIVVNQYVFIGSNSGNLYALDGTTGTQVWNVNLGAAIGASVNQLPFSGLAAGDGLLIVPSGTTVTAYTLSTNP